MQTQIRGLHASYKHRHKRTVQYNDITRPPFTLQVLGSIQKHGLREINANMCLTTGTPSVKLPYLLKNDKFRMVIKIFLFCVP
jgi:hypothetical protein